MEDQTALLMAWLEGEGERQRRPILPPPRANDPDPRGWVQVGVCVLVGALTAGVLACWLFLAKDREMRVTSTYKLYQWNLLRMLGDPNQSSLWEGEEVRVRSDGGAFGEWLCFRVFAIACATVIGALFFCAGCAFYNKLVGGKGSPSSVPQPLLVKAMGILFVTALVNSVMGFGPLSALVSFLVMADLSSALLPTTFTRGLLVSLCYFLVGLLVGVVLVFLFGGFWLVQALLRS